MKGVTGNFTKFIRIGIKLLKKLHKFQKKLKIQHSFNSFRKETKLL